MKIDYKSMIRKQIQNTGMSVVDFAKDCLYNGYEYSEALACDAMTYEEREEFREHKSAYLEECLKDCPF